MRFVLLQFFRASDFSIKVLSLIVLSFFLLEMLLRVECLAWNTTCYWRQSYWCVIGAEQSFRTDEVTEV